MPPPAPARQIKAAAAPAPPLAPHRGEGTEARRVPEPAGPVAQSTSRASCCPRGSRRRGVGVRGGDGRAGSPEKPHSHPPVPLREGTGGCRATQPSRAPLTSYPPPWARNGSRGAQRHDRDALQHRPPPHSQCQGKQPRGCRCRPTPPPARPIPAGRGEREARLRCAGRGSLIDRAGGRDTRVPRAVRVRPGRPLAAGRAASVTAAPPPAAPRAPAAVRAGRQRGRRARLAWPPPSCPRGSRGPPLPALASHRLAVPARGRGGKEGERARSFPGGSLCVGQGCAGPPGSGRGSASITPQPHLRAQPIGGPPSGPGSAARCQ